VRLHHHLSSFVPHPDDKNALVAVREFVTCHIRQGLLSHEPGRLDVRQLLPLMIRGKEIAVVGVEEKRGTSTPALERLAVNDSHLTLFKRCSRHGPLAQKETPFSMKLNEVSG
jgi:hypothetical protein